jgi:DNA-directed RNA polymerase subunit K/omega
MNPTILDRARRAVPHDQLLVNMVRLRIRQLNTGHRPLIAAPPGMGVADIALSEIAEEKLRSAPTTEEAAPAVLPSPIITFPAVPPAKKAA